MTLFGISLTEVDWWKVIETIKEWQDLTAAMIALSAALVTVRVMRTQIKQVDQHKRERRRGPYEAARAMLPLALNDIMTWIYAHADVYKQTYAALPTREQGQPLIAASAVPALHRGALDALQKMIEVEEMPVVRKLLAQIIHRYQYMKARQERLVNPSATTLILPINHEDALVETAHLHAIVEILYPYARHQTEAVDESAMTDAVKNALGMLDLREGQFARAGELAKNRIDRLASAEQTVGRASWFMRLLPDRLKPRR